MKTIPDTRLDALDFEQFERMLASHSWQLYTAKLAFELQRVTARCLTEMNVVELRRAQGAAAALQAVLARPQAILDDLRKQAGVNRPRKDE